MKQSQKKILIIDDDPDWIALVRDCLRREGFEVLYALHGRQGMTMARIHMPDLILLDVFMPGMNGIDTREALLKQPGLEDIPVILLTVAADKPARREGREMWKAGFRLADFMGKETKLTELARTARTVTASP